MNRIPDISAPVSSLPHETKNLAHIISAVFVATALPYALQAVIFYLLAHFSHASLQGDLPWIIASICTYGIALPCGVLLLRLVPMQPLVPRVIPGKRLFSAFLVIYAVGYAGGMIGMGVSLLIDLIPGTHAFDLSTSMDTMPLWAKIVAGCILAPIMEEWFFRKHVAGRLLRYGQWVAVIVSALLFGLMHGNFQQFFSATAFGIALGYLYVKTGNLRYTIFFHALVNTNSLLLASPLLISGSLIPLILFSQIVLAMIIAGFVLLGINKKRIRFQPRIAILPEKGWVKYVFGNWWSVALFATYAIIFYISIAA